MGFSSPYTFYNFFESIVLTKPNLSHTEEGTIAHFKAASLRIFFIATEAQTSLQIRCSWVHPWSGNFYSPSYLNLKYSLSVWFKFIQVVGFLFIYLFLGEWGWKGVLGHQNHISSITIYHLYLGKVSTNKD